MPVALVSLVTPDRQFFKAQCGLPSPVAERRETPLSHSFCQYVVEDGDALVVEDARLDERLADNPAIPDLGVIAYAGFPIRSPDGEVLGSFCAIEDRPRVWSRGDLEIISELAASRRPTWSRCARRPWRPATPAAGCSARSCPSRPRWRAASASAIYRPGEQRSLLGGDFFLCEPLPDGTVALLIGDVAGHGPEAAAFAMSLRSTWRALLLAPLGLEERAERLNTIALGQQPDIGVFATALLCEISPDRASARLVNAGHPPPVRLGHGGAHEVDAPPCPPLGVIARRAVGGRRAGARARRRAAGLHGRAGGGPRGPGRRSGSAAAPVLELAAACTRTGRTRTRC